MYLKKAERFKTLYLDPGEDAGWCLANGPKLLAAGTEKMWPLADYIWLALSSGGSDGPLGCGTEALSHSRKGVGERQLEPPIGRVVCEDFRLYPWKLKSMGWDPVRTARLIGAVTMMCRVFDLPFFLQPAAIKPEALILGAEEYYDHPLHENRHQNDAKQHFVYFRAFGPDGSPRTANSNEPTQQRVYQCAAVTPAGPRKKGQRVKKLTCRKPEGHDGEHSYS